MTALLCIVTVSEERAYIQKGRKIYDVALWLSLWLRECERGRKHVLMMSEAFNTGTSMTKPKEVEILN